jgi:hypothetical protein
VAEAEANGEVRVFGGASSCHRALFGAQPASANDAQAEPSLRLGPSLYPMNRLWGECAIDVGLTSICGSRNHEIQCDFGRPCRQAGEEYNHANSLYNCPSRVQHGFGKVMSQELPVQRTHAVENQLLQLRKQAVKLIEEGDGLKVRDIASLLGVSVDMATLVMKSLIGDTVEMRGATKGARYYSAKKGLTNRSSGLAAAPIHPLRDAASSGPTETLGTRHEP